MTAADKLCAGVHRAWFLARDDRTSPTDLPVVTRIRRRCRCHRAYRIDATYSDGRICRYLPTDQIDVVEVQP